LLDDLDCVCPEEDKLPELENLPGGPFYMPGMVPFPERGIVQTKKRGPKRNLLWWLFTQEKEEFIDVDGCVCKVPEQEAEPHTDVDRFDIETECTCDPLPASVCAYMKDALVMGFDAEGEHCVCHDMPCAGEEDDEPHIDIDRLENETDCVCDPLPAGLAASVDGACPIGIDSDGNDCMCEDMCAGAEPEPHVNINRYRYDEQCACDPLNAPNSMRDMLLVGTMPDGEDCLCEPLPPVEPTE